MFTTPILFLVFNRPAATKKVFAQIRKTKPSFLFVAADGPRENILGEKDTCEEVRNLVLANIDWDCEVKTLFRKKNLGCGKAVSQAITWFFEHVEEGIILEDDCLPDLSFFSFCENLLKMYADDERIFIITGTNLVVKFRNSKSSYVFSNYAGIWGWATWKRAWEKYDYAMRSWELESNRLIVSKFFENKADLKFYLEKFDDTYKEVNVSTWDYQWYYTRIIYGALGIIPSKNLISNIGFDKDATHTLDAMSEQANFKTFNINKKLIHPPTVEVNLKYEMQIQQPLVLKTLNFKYFVKRGFEKIIPILSNK